MQLLQNSLLTYVQLEFCFPVKQWSDLIEAETDSNRNRKKLYFYRGPKSFETEKQLFRVRLDFDFWFGQKFGDASVSASASASVPPIHRSRMVLLLHEEKSWEGREFGRIQIGRKTRLVEHVTFKV